MSPRALRLGIVNVPGRPLTGDLDAAYASCRRIAAEHGRTYYLATTLLSPHRRQAVHALYAFARMVDDIVDHADNPTRVLDPLDSTRRGLAPAHRSTVVGRRAPARRTETPRVQRPAPSEPEPAQHLDIVEKQLRLALDHRDIDTTDTRRRQIITAAADTITRYDIAHTHIQTFLDAMRMDIPGTATHRTRYATMGELREYMWGSAAAIGLQLLPVLGTVVPVAEAEPAAAALGEAFQLTNFLRDVAEDLDRDRVYLPTDELRAFGVDEPHLRACHQRGHTDAPLRRALAHLIAVNRDIYRRAVPGIALLAPRVRPAIATAATLYAEILDRIEAADYQVFTSRATVPHRRRILVAAKGLTTPTGRL
ncbi:phytoene/squalene synthase family protein [Nocardia alba]|uniref:Phytoene synthase n=1 Tax=Nocardia alba TaxID=225051 RepID=A0A4R1F8A6_9NOCA|nr:phytoene/squalene synthase family protein [Nocardia alba]TCJ90163.1 phytoene synthase [Nocardia alba]